MPDMSANQLPTILLSTLGVGLVGISLLLHAANTLKPQIITHCFRRYIFIVNFVYFVYVLPDLHTVGGSQVELVAGLDSEEIVPVVY